MVALKPGAKVKILAALVAVAMLLSTGLSVKYSYSQDGGIEKTSGAKSWIELRDPQVIIDGSKILAEADIHNAGGKLLSERNYTVKFRVSARRPAVPTFSIKKAATLEIGETMKIRREFTPEELGVKSVKDAKSSLGKGVNAECVECDLDADQKADLFERENGELVEIGNGFRLLSRSSGVTEMPASIEVLSSTPGPSKKQLRILNGQASADSKFFYIVTSKGDENPNIGVLKINEGAYTVVNVEAGFEVDRALVCPTPGKESSSKCLEKRFEAEKPVEKEVVEEEEEMQEKENKGNKEKDNMEETKADEVEKEKKEEGIQDADSDGVADSKDNCPQKYNPEQRDKDGDGIGDRCDSEKVEKKPSFTESMTDMLSAVGSWFVG
ncbi:MAG: hypothetical protein SVV03_06020 [Candidatus Nanohaloarchaea archaeon]|nr:hypothetical protein [Candidatus Nanohaloarchaea archaeon]